jgi:hypothetical protein
MWLAFGEMFSLGALGGVFARNLAVVERALATLYGLMNAAF